MKNVQKKPRRILLADDDFALREITRELLQHHGHLVTTVDCGAEALRVFSMDPGRFDLVILDQEMPDLRGTDIAPRLLDIRSNVPIVLYTGYGNDDLAEKARKAGIKEIVLKPLPIDLLLDLIDRTSKGPRVNKGRRERQGIQLRQPI